MRQRRHLLLVQSHQPSRSPAPIWRRSFLRSTTATATIPPSTSSNACSLVPRAARPQRQLRCAPPPPAHHAARRAYSAAPPAAPPAANGGSGPPGAALAPPPDMNEREAAIWELVRDGVAGVTELEVQDISGGCGSMYLVSVASESFRGMNMLKQQRLVNAVLKPTMEKEDWHGVRINTKVP